MKSAKNLDLTQGKVTPVMLQFAIPLILGNLLQQLYNIADTFIVGRFLGAAELAAVGSSYTLMVFITSIVLGLCLGSGALFSIHYGAGNLTKLQQTIQMSFLLIGGLSVVLNLLAFACLNPVIRLLQVPPEVYGLMYDYLYVVYWGIGFTFLYNYAASLLRALGDSVTPLKFLALSVILNIALDLVFILGTGWGVQGAAAATVIAQGIAAAGLCLVCVRNQKHLFPEWHWCRFSWRSAHEILAYSSLTCIQQSVMNFGILMVQGLVNSFGTTVMAAFAVAVKIDSFAYMPVQDFGNAFSTFIAQNFGAGNQQRIREGIRSAVRTVTVFSLSVSVLVFVFARQLMLIFVHPSETELIGIGVEYLRIEGAFYLGIGFLFLLYGFYRAVYRPMMSVVLTIISLGMRVLLAYLLAGIPAIGVQGIWWAIPIGWLLADLTGWIYYKRLGIKIFDQSH